MSSGRNKDIFSHADFNLEGLIRLAKRLRRRACTCDESQIPKTGALNWAIFLEFDDGIQWVFRAPRSADVVTRCTTSRMLASEAATLKYIRKHTSVPVPEVFDYSSTYDNEIGIPYILMSKATGRSLARYGWRADVNPEPERPVELGQYMTDEQKNKIMHQLGRYAGQLFALRFPMIGSLFEGDEGYYIGPCLSPGHVLQRRDEIEEVKQGPFPKEADYYVSLADALYIHAEQEPMGYHVLRAPVPVQEEYSSFASYYAATDRWNDFVTLGGLAESSPNRLQYCVASKLIQDFIIPSLLDGQTHIGFPLSHHDISDQNLFVDDELNITCVIDWAFSSTVPPAQLLAPPGLPHPRDLIMDPFLINAYRLGFETTNNNEMNKISPNAWKVGQMVSYFMRIVNLDALQDYKHLEDLYTLASSHIARRDDEDNASSLSTTLATQATTLDMLALGRELAAEDDSESEVHQREREYFSAVGATRVICARKVALAAQMNPRFVADGRLWRWIAAAMKPSDNRDETARIASARELPVAQEPETVFENVRGEGSRGMMCLNGCMSDLNE